MKNSFFYLLLTVLFTAFTGCSGDDDSNSVNANPQPVIDAAVSGSWKITYFFDTDSEETNNFTNYVFTFGPNGVLTATNGTDTVTGTWSVTDSHNSGGDGSDDDNSSHNSNDLDFNISFASPANFAELSDDWDILSYNTSKIELKDVSGGNGGTDLLTFEKI